jgi:hypothetical protein
LKRQIPIYLDEQDLKSLDIFAKRLGLSRSAYCRLIIKDKLQDMDKEEKGYENLDKLDKLDTNNLRFTANALGLRGDGSRQELIDRINKAREDGYI